MSKDKDASLLIIARGERVILRGWLATDCESLVRWRAHGEWRLLDAPWFGYRTVTTAEQAKRDREWFMKQLNGGEDSWLNRRAVIATPDNTPLGWINRYGEKKNPHVCFVGIGICEDAFLNRGLGTEALRLWIDHLFATSDVHKLCLETWSFNPRMIRVAEKVGFMYEGRQREMRHWQGEWLDLLHFGILREEWQGNDIKPVAAGCTARQDEPQARVRRRCEWYLASIDCRALHSPRGEKSSKASSHRICQVTHLIEVDANIAGSGRS
jgi:RimJ/RimL family protein N-acetyltransferase